MQRTRPLRLAYVVKRYPRFSETFIVNEILAHERAGVPVDIFAVRRVNEPHFQPIIGQVRSLVTYIPDNAPKVESFWSLLREAAIRLPDFWPALAASGPAEVGDVNQAILLALKARELGVTHIHAHFATVATTVARLASRFSGIAYTFTAHAKDIFQDQVDEDALRRKMKDAASVVTVSDFNAEWLHRHHGAAANRVRRIYNGLDLSAFPYAPPDRRPPEIVAVGRLVEKKGFDVLVHACALLRSRGVPFHCTIIGDGLLHEELARLIDTLGLRDQVLLAGALPRSDVAAVLQGAAVCAAPCVTAADGDQDGLPTVLLEAMALGTPCVATDVTGLPEIVRNGETGLCVPQRDPDALAGAIARLLADESLRVLLAEQARALIEREFDVDRNAASLRALFAAVADQRAEALRAVG